MNLWSIVAAIFLLCGFGLIRKWKKIAFTLSIVGGIAMTVFGFDIMEPSIIALNTIFVIIGIINLWLECKKK